MKIRGLYTDSSVNTYTIETIDGKFFIFNITPFRKVTESELKPVYHGMNAKQVKPHLHNVADYIPALYGMEIE